MKVLWLGLGWISLLLGIIGAFLPLLPTVPFLLLTAYCFSRGSDKLHHWLMQHPKFGPPIKQWQKEGAIATSTKVLALGLMLFSVALTLVMQVPMIGLLSQVSILFCVSVFILTRPAPAQIKHDIVIDLPADNKTT